MMLFFSLGSAPEDYTFVRKCVIDFVFLYDFVIRCRILLTVSYDKMRYCVEQHSVMMSIASDTLKVGADWKYSFGGMILIR